MAKLHASVLTDPERFVPCSARIRYAGHDIGWFWRFDRPGKESIGLLQRMVLNLTGIFARPMYCPVCERDESKIVYGAYALLLLGNEPMNSESTFMVCGICSECWPTGDAMPPNLVECLHKAVRKTVEEADRVVDEMLARMFVQQGTAETDRSKLN